MKNVFMLFLLLISLVNSYSQTSKRKFRIEYINMSSVSITKNAESYFSNFSKDSIKTNNGIGFDVEAVKNAGMSVGLRSMQTRLERLGGHLTVQSEAGRTCLKACLPV